MLENAYQVSDMMARTCPGEPFCCCRLNGREKNGNGGFRIASCMTDEDYVQFRNAGVWYGYGLRNDFRIRPSAPGILESLNPLPPEQ